MLIESINSEEFLSVVAPLLRRSNADDLAEHIRERWTPRQLCQLLSHECPDVRKTACVVLGLVGDDKVAGCLTAALHDEDPQVNQLAEHGLWSIWFRGGNAEAQCHFKRGLAAMEREEPRAALQWFHRAQRADPRFAEAHNQCAMVHYMLEQWESAVRECQRTLDLLPTHTGALAALGHCYTQMGDLASAACLYREALEINPRMEAVALALERIESCFSRKIGVRSEGDF